jgi:hypothetical protein
MKYYDSINNIPVFTFYEVIEKQDTRYLIKKYKEKDAAKISPQFLITLQETFDEIILAFNATNVSTKSIKGVRQKINIEYMESVYNTTVKIINLYLETGLIEYLFCLNDLNWDFDSTKEIQPQLQSINAKLKGLKNKIRIEKIRHDREFNKEPKKEKNWIAAMDKTAIYIETTLERKYPVNPKKTTLLRWCNLLEMCNQRDSNNG